MTSAALFLLGISAAVGSLLACMLLLLRDAHDSASTALGRVGAYAIGLTLMIAAGAVWYLGIRHLRAVEHLHRALGLG